MIKPEFFSSESMAEVSAEARLCFIGLWLCADDEGRAIFAERSLRKDICGMHSTTPEEFIGYLCELEEVGSIRFFTDGHEVYLTIPNFGVYQTINRPQKSKITERSLIVPVSIREAPVNVPPKERKKELMKKADAGGADATAAPDWLQFYQEGN
jgi:hypothetical protein